MQVQKIQPQNFEAKQRFLPKETHKQMQELLHKMNAKTSFQENGDIFYSKILTRIRLGKDGKFVDERFLSKPSANLFGRSTFNYKKTGLIIDNKTGEVDICIKPFWQTWNKTCKKVAEFFDIALKNFDNPDVINHDFLGIQGFTKKGADKIREIQKRLGL